MNLDCKFCKIINGEIESYTVYEDELVKTFLDINPISLGHTLIVPKKHYENIYDIPEKTLKCIITVAKNIAEKYKKSLGSTGINILHASGKDAQQSVLHFHIHLIPRYSDDGLDLEFHKHFKPELDLKEVFEKIKNPKLKREHNR